MEPICQNLSLDCGRDGLWWKLSGDHSWTVPMRCVNEWCLTNAAPRPGDNNFERVRRRGGFWVPRTPSWADSKNTRQFVRFLSATTNLPPCESGRGRAPAAPCGCSMVGCADRAALWARRQCGRAWTLRICT
jgi:hypothetical protein